MVAVVAACFLLGGLTLVAVRAIGGDDGSSGTPPEGSQPFSHGEVPFTFEYPDTFAATPPEELPAGFLAVLGIGPVSFIDVRLTDNGERSDDDIIRNVLPRLHTPNTLVVETGTIQLDGDSGVTAVVTDSTGEELTLSRLTFFRAGGRTWELGCQSRQEDQEVMDAACTQMLATFERV